MSYKRAKAGIIIPFIKLTHLVGLKSKGCISLEFRNCGEKLLLSKGLNNGQRSSSF